MASISTVNPITAAALADLDDSGVEFFHDLLTRIHEDIGLFVNQPRCVGATYELQGKLDSLNFQMLQVVEREMTKRNVEI